MMTNEQYLLGKLAEEASELAQIAIKAQQFGLEEVFGGQDLPLSNKDRVQSELNDVLGIVMMLNEDCRAGINQDESAWVSKRLKVGHYRAYAGSLGNVEL
tara:strand:+ start:687 stop:986 length:300 start_codon:yes stop_codon:yes gene_type:complete